MREGFARWFPLCMEYEGGYSNDPGDPGGPTKYGVTIYEVAELRGIPSSKVRANWDALVQLVKNVTLEDAASITYGRYWKPCRCDELPLGVDLVVADYAYNSGNSRPLRALHEILGLDQSPVATDDLIQAANDYPNPDDIVDLLCDQRLAFMRMAKGRKSNGQTYDLWPLFGKGWSRRVTRMRSVGLEMSPGGFSAGYGGAAQMIVAQADHKRQARQEEFDAGLALSNMAVA